MQQQSADVQDQIQPRPSGDMDILGLFRAFRASRDSALRAELVSRHLPLVHTVSRRFSGLGESLEDLVQEGSIGLLNAIDLFDPDRGVKFSTYASHLIASQIQHYLRDRGRLIRQPAWVQELNTKVTRAAEQLVQEFGRDPQPAEIAERLQVSESSVQNVLSARELNHLVSLEAPADAGGESDMPVLDVQRSGMENSANLQLPLEDRLVLDEAIASLKALEQKVVRLFFFEDLTQTEIARRQGISVNYSSYLLRRAVTKIKAFMEEQQRQDAAALMDAEPPTSTLPANLAINDEMTGMYSGPYLQTRVAEEIARSQRYPTNFALMLASVQGLAMDSEAAPPALRSIGRMFRNTTRNVDLVAHLGSGIFAMLLPHTGREARILGERLCAHFSRQEAATPFTLNVSYVVFPIDGVTVEMLYERAQQAMAASRKLGPNSVHGAQPSRTPAGTR